MENNPSKSSVFIDVNSTSNSPGREINFTLTREMVHTRTRQLAVIGGRRPQDIIQADYEQAKCELTGESDPDRQQAVINSGHTRESIV